MVFPFSGAVFLLQLIVLTIFDLRHVVVYPYFLHSEERRMIVLVTDITANLPWNTRIWATVTIVAPILWTILKLLSTCSLAYRTSVSCIINIIVGSIGYLEEQRHLCSYDHSENVKIAYKPVQSKEQTPASFLSTE